MNAPKRIQRKRTKGFKLPPNTVCVTRPSRLANPFKVGKVDGLWRVRDLRWGSYDVFYDAEADAREDAVDRFARHALPLLLARDMDTVRAAGFVACYCDPDDGMACHGDVLIAAAIALPASPGSGPTSRTDDPASAASLPEATSGCSGMWGDGASSPGAPSKNDNGRNGG